MDYYLERDYIRDLVSLSRCRLSTACTPPAYAGGSDSFTFLNLNAFVITDTELNVIARLAIIGESKIPKMGKSTPAAIGTPMML